MILVRTFKDTTVTLKVSGLCRIEKLVPDLFLIYSIVGSVNFHKRHPFLKVQRFPGLTLQFSENEISFMALYKTV